MRKTKKIKLSSISFKILLYGSYSVLCHGILVMLYALTSEISASSVLTIRFAPMLEYTVMSLTLTVIGGLLADIVYKDIQKR